jgi:hypothetical protein
MIVHQQREKECFLTQMTFVLPSFFPPSLVRFRPGSITLTGGWVPDEDEERSSFKFPWQK